MTKEERKAFQKNIRKIGLPKTEDVKKGKGITTSSPGGSPNKDGTITRTKKLREKFATKEGVLTKTKIRPKKDEVGDPAKSKPKKVSTRGNPLKDRPRSIAEAKRRGEVYFYDSKGVKKIAATAADLKRTGLTLRQYANKFAPKKQTKKDAEALKPYALKKRGGGMMKKKGMAAGGRMKKKGMARGGMMMKKKGMAKGGAMKKKGMAAGGKLKMVMKDGKKVPFFAADGKGKMRGGGMMKKKMMKGGGKVTVVGRGGKLKEMDKKKYELTKKMFDTKPKLVKGKKAGGMMKKKGYAMGGAMKKKGYKKGGKVLKMRGGGLATRGTSFTIK